MAFRPTPQEDLAELKCFVLETMREILVNNVDPSNFLPFLRSKFVITGRESDTIKSCCSKSVYDGAEKLIDVLCTKGAKGYDVFCDAILHNETQVFLLTELNKRLEMVKHVKKEQERTRIEQEKAHIEQEKAHAEQVRQRILLEQRRIAEQNEVRPYQPRPTVGSAHTTTCLSYIPHHAPRPQYMDQTRMPSRSPNSPDHQQCVPLQNPNWYETQNERESRVVEQTDTPCGQPIN